VANAGTNFAIPLNEFDSIRFDTDLRHTNLKINAYTDSLGNNTNAFTSRQIREFVRENGNKYLTLGETVSWTHDTLNRALFPSQGGQQRASAMATIPGSDLTYYKVSYRQQHYFPIAKDFTLKLNGEVGYGNGYGGTNGLPFFENFFAGGTGSVRGFKNNTLGPRDTQENLLSGQVLQGNPIGGSSKIIGNAELFFPVPFMSETKSVRLGTFFDAGTVSNGFSVSQMRYSTGLSGEWLSPFGALSVSAAVPLNSQTTDQKQAFQFNFGQSF
jgi:outer membrane protein insertion porin family